MEPTWIVAIMAGVAVAAFVLVRSANRRRLAPLAELLDGGSGEPVGWFRFRLEGHVEGREVAFVSVPGSRHSPPRFLVRLACPVTAGFRISREGGGTRFAKRLHLLKDAQVNDPELDAKYVFACADPESFGRWIRASEVREAVIALMDGERVHSVALRDGRLESVLVRPRRESYAPASARRVVERLQVLARSLLVGA